MGMIRSSDSQVDLTQVMELYLATYRSSCMKLRLSLKPIIALCLSQNPAIQRAKPIEVLRYVARHAQEPTKTEAATNLSFLEDILATMHVEVSTNDAYNVCRCCCTCVSCQSRSC
jgi:hypothetical protein